MASPICYAVWTQMSGRRRVRLSYRQTAQAFIVGFTGRASHHLSTRKLRRVADRAKTAYHTFDDWAPRICLQDRVDKSRSICLAVGADILLLPDDTLADKVLTALSAELTACQSAVYAYANQSLISRCR